MLYWKYAAIVWKGYLSKRSTFLVSTFGQLLVPFFVLAGILMLFARFGAVAGYSRSEVLLCFAVIHLSFGLAQLFARGFDEFSVVLSKGEFDRILVRPRGILLQVLGARFEFARIGRLALGFVVLGVAVSSLDIAWDYSRIFALVFMTASGTVLFAGIFLIGASLCFWTTDGLEVMNILTDGGREMSQYPLGIYNDAVRKFFTFVVPFGCVNYYPLNYVLGRPGFGAWTLLTPLAAWLFLLPCWAVWRAGLRRYASTGS